MALDLHECRLDTHGWYYVPGREEVAVELRLDNVLAVQNGEAEGPDSSIDLQNFGEEACGEVSA